MSALAPDQAVAVLVGPTCPTCESQDCTTQALDAELLVLCPDCGTQYRWFEVPSQDGDPSGFRSEAICRFCGVHFEPDADHVTLCEDCELSDCAFCGATTNRPMLSANLACEMCEGVAA